MSFTGTDWSRRSPRHLFDLDKLFTRAEGLYFFDDKGRRYRDFTAGFGALNLGRNPAEVLAQSARRKRFPRCCSQDFHRWRARSPNHWPAFSPADCLSHALGTAGAEAVELALKAARAATGRTRLVSCRNAYHGLSFGAMSVSSSSRYQGIFGPLLEHCDRVPFGDVEALQEQLAKRDVGAFIVEPVQGEGGAMVPPQGYGARSAP